MILALSGGAAWVLCVAIICLSTLLALFTLRIWWGEADEPDKPTPEQTDESSRSSCR